MSKSHMIHDDSELLIFVFVYRGFFFFLFSLYENYNSTFKRNDAAAADANVKKTHLITSTSGK